MKSLFQKLKDGFQKTRVVMSDGIQQVLQQRRQIDPELYDDLEAILLRADVGPATTDHLLDRLRDAVRSEGLEDPAQLRSVLKRIMEEILTQGRPPAPEDGAAPEPTTGALAEPRSSARGASGSRQDTPAGAGGVPAGSREPSASSPGPSAGTPAPAAGSPDAATGPVAGPRSASGVDPEVVLVVGVNGVGKTTSLAKLVQREKSRGRKPLIVASDTFRAAASEQLEIWAQRLDVDIVRSRTGADPGSVAFDGIRAAQSRGAGVVFVDTAGRLQTKGNLMDELAKIHRVCGKALSGAPHETLLVLDATIGQNALSQARLFSEAVPLTGIVLAKLDGTSKGGVILAIAHELKIPVRYVGVGEQAEDLLDFDPGLFAEGLVGEVPERVAS